MQFLEGGGGGGGGGICPKCPILDPPLIFKYIYRYIKPCHSIIGVMLVSGKEEKSTYISLILIQELYFSSFQSFSISRLAWGVSELVIKVPHH